MTIKKKSKKTKIEIDLTGPQGNAFYLLGAVISIGRRLEYSNEKIKEIQEKMKVSDYENLIKVFDDEFGEYVTLYR